jgi:hypothetical protein
MLDKGVASFFGGSIGFDGWRRRWSLPWCGGLFLASFVEDTHESGAARR